MELTINVRYNEILNLIRQLPSDLRLNLLREIEKEYKMKSVPKHKNGRGLGIWKGKVWMAEDFNEPLEEFKEYMN
jgi:hypothetical protein